MNNLPQGRGDLASQLDEWALGSISSGNGDSSFPEVPLSGNASRETSPKDSEMLLQKARNRVHQLHGDIGEGPDLAQMPREVQREIVDPRTSHDRVRELVRAFLHEKGGSQWGALGETSQ